MKKIDTRYFLFLIPVTLLIISLLLYPRLPDDLPMQFSMSGDVNWTLPKEFGIWPIPLIEAFVIIGQWNKKNVWFTACILVIISIIMLFILIIAI